VPTCPVVRRNAKLQRCVNLHCPPCDAVRSAECWLKWWTLGTQSLCSEIWTLFVTSFCSTSTVWTIHLVENRRPYLLGISDNISVEMALEFVSTNLCERQYKRRHGSLKDFTTWEEKNTPRQQLRLLSIESKNEARLMGRR